MKFDEPARVGTAQIQQVFGNGLGAAVKKSTRIAADVPFDEIAVEDAVNLKVLAPENRRRHRQSRATDPLNRIMSCGFHDCTHEGEDAFAGKVTIEAR